MPPIQAFGKDPKEYKINHGGHQQAHQWNGANDPERAASLHNAPKQKVVSLDKQHAFRPNRISTSKLRSRVKWSSFDGAASRMELRKINRTIK
jgi:hypothetical protein